MACFGILSACETARLYARAESVVGERRDDDMEGRTAGLGEEGEDVEGFDEGARP